MLNSNGNNTMLESEVSIKAYVYIWRGKGGCEQVNEGVFNVDEIV
jgi:hypothetical protein